MLRATAEVESPAGTKTAVMVPVGVVLKELPNAIGPTVKQFLPNRIHADDLVNAAIHRNPRLYSDREEGLFLPIQTNRSPSSCPAACKRVR